MTLTIELSPEQEECLTAAARQRGLAPTELAQELLVAQLPRLTRTRTKVTGAEERSLARVARVREVRGKYAQSEVTTEELHRARQVDKEREERLGGEAQ